MKINSRTFACTGISILALSAACAAPAFAQGTTAGSPGTPAPGATSDAGDAQQLPPEQAPRQDGRSQDDGQNEIVVTARRVSERLQDVPIAVSVLTSEDLSRQALDGLEDIAEKTVGLSFERLSPAVVQPAIRGQTNLRVDAPVQNVAFYLDGIYLQRGYLVDQRLLDLDRIEVIKGPQSALYGRNAFAGAVNMVSRTPDLDEMSGKVAGTIGNHERYEIRGSINVPIIPDRLAVFLSAAHSQFDGTWRNNHPLANAKGVLTKGNIGGWNNELYQGRVIFKPVDSLTFDAFYIHTDRFEEASPTYTISTQSLLSAFNTLNASPVAGLTPPFAVQNRLFVGELPARPIVAAGDVTRPPGLVTDPRAFGLKGPTDIIGGKVVFEPTGSDFAVSYQYGLTKARITGRGSVASNPLAPVIIGPTNFGTIFDASGSGSSFKGQSHEMRFTYSNAGPLTGFFGLNYARTRDVNSNISESAPVNSTQLPDPSVAFPVGPGLPFPSAFFQRFGFIERKEEIVSAFAFAKWSPSEQFDLTLEGRYTYEDQQATDFLTRDPGNPAIQNRNPPVFNRDTRYFTPRASATYKFTRNNNVYASVARGVKSGGLNGNTPFLGQRTYDDETNWTYEVGTKNSFFGNALQLNLAAFYTDWKNLQSSVVRLQANGTAPSFFAVVPSTVGNIGGVKVYGVEVEGTFRIAEPLRLNFAASYNRSRYRDDAVSQRFGASGNCDGVVCTTIPGTPTRVLPLGGNQLERVPEFDSVVGLTYNTKFADDWEFFARGDVTYQTKAFVDEANLAFVPSRTLANASTGVSFGNFSVNAWIKNIFDKKYVATAFFLIGTNGALSATYTPVLGDRRTFGLTGSVGF